MPRIAPDSNDIIVHYLNDPGPTHSNVGTAGSDGDFTDYGGPVPSVSGLLDKAYYIPGQFISSNHDGTGGANSVTSATPEVSISTWIFLRRYYSGYAAIVNKQYAAGSWSPPYTSCGLYTNFTTDGRWIAYITTSGTLKNITIGTNFALPMGKWSHLGMTWDGTNLKAYLNGNLAGSSVPGGGDIDYNTNGSPGKWFVGCVPDTGTIDGGNFIIQDVRIANIARPQSYFQNIYYNGFTP